MKTKPLYFFLVALFLSAFAGISGAQPLLSGYDSLPMAKPSVFKNKYRIIQKAQNLPDSFDNASGAPKCQDNSEL